MVRFLRCWGFLAFKVSIFLVQKIFGLIFVSFSWALYLPKQIWVFSSGEFWASVLYKNEFHARILQSGPSNAKEWSKFVSAGPGGLLPRKTSHLGPYTFHCIFASGKVGCMVLRFWLTSYFHTFRIICISGIYWNFQFPRVKGCPMLHTRPACERCSKHYLSY